MNKCVLRGHTIRDVLFSLVRCESYEKGTGICQVRVDLEDGIGVVGVVQTEEVSTEVDGDPILNHDRNIVSIEQSFHLVRGL